MGKTFFSWLLMWISLLSPNAPARSETTSAPAANDTIPFEIYAGYLLIVHGTLGGLSNLRFAVDTGCSHSLIDRKLARRMGLSGRLGTVFNFGRSVPVEWVDVSGVQVGSLTVNRAPMMVGDLAYSKAFATQVDVILGLDLLRTRNFSIDYRSKQIRMGGLEISEFRVPMDNGPMFVSVELQLRDRPIRVLVDTGMRGMLLYQDRVGAEVREAKSTAAVDAFSLGGGMRVREAIAPRVKLGETDLDRTVFLMNGPAPTTLPQIDGYLGTSKLNARRIDFDFRNNTLGWNR